MTGPETAETETAEHCIVVHLDQLLLDRKMTQVELAEKAGIHPVQISKIRNGHAKGIRYATLDALCEALDCQPGDLLTRE